MSKLGIPNATFRNELSLVCPLKFKFEFNVAQKNYITVMLQVRIFFQLAQLRCNGRGFYHITSHYELLHLTKNSIFRRGLL